MMRVMTTTISYLAEYIPTRFSATAQQIADRRMVWNFKDGIYSNDIMDAFVNAITRMAGINTIVCFIPASSQERTTKRFAKLCSYINSHTSAHAKIDGVTRTDNSLPGHIYGKSGDPASSFVVDSSIVGKDVILIDDVITRGTTFNATARKLLAAGAKSVRGLFLAKTVHPAA